MGKRKDRQGIIQSPVVFHEMVVKCRKDKNGVVVCTTAPLPMEKWHNEDTINFEKPKSAYDTINDTLSSHLDDMECEGYDEIDEYTKGYDQGYKAGLMYCLNVIK